MLSRSREGLDRVLSKISGLDGVYVLQEKGKLRFRQVAPPTAEELQELLHRVKAVGLAQIFDADSAVAAGYLDEAVAEDELLVRAIAQAEQLSALDMVAYKHTKGRVREDLNAALDAAFEKEMA